jgi:geranylgeranyl pyrophosphate synthase
MPGDTTPSSADAAGAAMVPADIARVPQQATRRLGAWLRALPEALREPAAELADRPAKSLRPLLVAACAAFGRPGAADVAERAALVELLHLASLLHDDVIDGAPLRRGAPSAYAAYGAEHAMLAGLGCFALVGMRAARLGGEEHLMVARVSAQLAIGELADIERAFDTRVLVDDYVELAERKTGSLLGLACALGALAGGVDAPAAAALHSFGVRFGIAFQIVDDCLDLRRARPEGKPLGTDHLRGLFGCPTIFALAADTTGELRRLLLAPDLRADDLPRVHELVERHGGVDAALSLARQHYESALALLAPLDPAPVAVLTTVSALRWPA